jgi:putative hydrolase of the HAD superfamily
VLFDAAGTLVHTAEPVGESYARLAREHGVDVPAWRVDEAFRRVLAAAPPMVFAGLGGREARARERGWWRDVVRATWRAADQSVRFADFERYFEALYAHFAQAHAWRAAPGAHACLEALRERGVALGVVSNFDHRLEPILAGLGLAPLLDVVLRPGVSGFAKPDPRAFVAALARLRVRAEEAAYVGDDVADGRSGAEAAGLHAVEARGLATLAGVPERLFALFSQWTEECSR